MGRSRKSAAERGITRGTRVCRNGDPRLVGTVLVVATLDGVEYVTVRWPALPGAKGAVLLRRHQPHLLTVIEQ